MKKSSNVWQWDAYLFRNSPKLIHHSLILLVSLATNLAITWATVEFGAWSSAVHHENMLKNSSCHLEGGILSMVNRCFEFVLDD